MASEELDLAMHLLGENHYMYKSITIRKYFLEAYSLCLRYLVDEDSTMLGEAENLLFKALDIDSNAAYPYFQLGWIYNIRGYSYDVKGDSARATIEYRKAFNTYEKYRKLVPNNPRAYNNIGYAYNALGVYDSAIINFKSVIKLDSNYSVNLFLIKDSSSTKLY